MMIPTCFRAGGGEVVVIFPLFFKGFFLGVGMSQSGAARPEVHSPRPDRLPIGAMRPIDAQGASPAQIPDDGTGALQLLVRQVRRLL